MDNNRPLPPGWSRHFSQATQMWYYYRGCDGTRTYEFPTSDSSFNINNNTNIIPNIISPQSQIHSGNNLNMNNNNSNNNNNSSNNSSNNNNINIATVKVLCNGSNTYNFLNCFHIPIDIHKRFCIDKKTMVKPPQPSEVSRVIYSGWAESMKKLMELNGNQKKDLYCLGQGYEATSFNDWKPDHQFFITGKCKIDEDWSSAIKRELEEETGLVLADNNPPAFILLKSTRYKLQLTVIDPTTAFELVEYPPSQEDFDNVGYDNGIPYFKVNPGDQNVVIGGSFKITVKLKDIFPDQRYTKEVIIKSCGCSSKEDPKKLARLYIWQNSQFYHEGKMVYLKLKDLNSLKFSKKDNNKKKAKYCDELDVSLISYDYLETANCLIDINRCTKPSFFAIESLTNINNDNKERKIQILLYGTLEDMQNKLLHSGGMKSNNDNAVFFTLTKVSDIVPHVDCINDRIFLNYPIKPVDWDAATKYAANRYDPICNPNGGNNNNNVSRNKQQNQDNDYDALLQDMEKFDLYDDKNDPIQALGISRKKICKFWQKRGICTKGDTCEFVHVSISGQISMTVGLNSEDATDGKVVSSTIPIKNDKGDKKVTDKKAFAVEQAGKKANKEDKNLQPEYQRLLSFGKWFIDRMKDNGWFSKELHEASARELRLYDSVDLQRRLCEQFDSESRGVNEMSVKPSPTHKGGKVNKKDGEQKFFKSDKNSDKYN